MWTTRTFASKCKDSKAQVQEMMVQKEQPTEMFVNALGGSKSDVGLCLCN